MPQNSKNGDRNQLADLVAFIAVLATGVVLLTIGHLTASALTTGVAALVALFSAWRYRRPRGRTTRPVRERPPNGGDLPASRFRPPLGPPREDPLRSSAMRRSTGFAVLLAGGVVAASGVVAPAHAATGSAPVTRQAAGDLKTDLDKIISDSRLNGATVGLTVRNANTGAVLYDHNADTQVTPASNNKLETSTAAFGHPRDRLPVPYQRSTRVASNLYLKGTGDPTMRGRRLRPARRRGRRQGDQEGQGRAGRRRHLVRLQARAGRLGPHATCRTTTPRRTPR